MDLICTKTYHENAEVQTVKSDPCFGDALELPELKPVRNELPLQTGLSWYYVV